MKFQFTILVVFYLIVQGYAFKDHTGERPDDMEMVSYKASIHIMQKSRNVRICSGVIVDAQHVLTIATCFHPFLDADFKAHIRVGSLTSHAGGVTHELDDGLMHPHFDAETHRHNICIVTIKKNIIELGSTVNKIPINYDYIIGCKEVTIIGFGEPFVSGEVPAKELYRMNSTTMDIYQCGDAVQGTIGSKFLFEETLCVRQNTMIEVCTSDEGAAVIYKNQLIGILSQMPSTLGCSGQLPYLFTRIGHYHSWLNTHLNSHLFEKAF